MENPNPYNDDDYLKASTDLHFQGGPLVDALWKSGATLDNIGEELANLLDETLEGRFSVAIQEL